MSQAKRELEMAEAIIIGITIRNEKWNKRVVETNQKPTWEETEMRGKGKLGAFMVQKKQSQMGVGIQGRGRFIVTGIFNGRM